VRRRPQLERLIRQGPEEVISFQEARSLLQVVVEGEL
jgi:hypothetical protein